jgi:hypothetical protein
MDTCYRIRYKKMPINSAGFTIRSETLENLKPPKWWNDDYEITYQDDRKGHVSLRDASDADVRKIIGFCKKVSQIAYTNDNVLSAIMEGGKSYILDNGPIDNAMEAIENKLSLYSEE